RNREARPGCPSRDPQLICPARGATSVRGVHSESGGAVAPARSGPRAQRQPRRFFAPAAAALEISKAVCTLPALAATLGKSRTSPPPHHAELHFPHRTICSREFQTPQ